MANPYAALGVAPGATDAEVRKRYLELTREFPPEQHPERFAAVRKAYEKLKTLDARALYHLVQEFAEDTIDDIIEEAACRTPRQRVKLQSLLKAAIPPFS